MKELIKTIKLYSDGTYEEITNSVINELSTTELLDKVFRDPAASTRIKTNVAIFLVGERFWKESNKNYFSDAISTLATYLSVDKSTVLDKLYRQLDQTSSSYRKLLANAIESKDLGPYKELLKKYSGTRTEDDDLSLIEEFIA